VSRPRERRAAVFAVYQHDLTGRPIEQLLEDDPSPYARLLAAAVVANRGALDRLIDRHAAGWSVERIHPLERAILRVALQEIADPPLEGSAAPIPPEGAIDEAVRAAKTYCEAAAPAFINGILDAALRELRENGALRGEQGETEHERAS